MYCFCLYCTFFLTHTKRWDPAVDCNKKGACEYEARELLASHISKAANHDSYINDVVVYLDVLVNESYQRHVYFLPLLYHVMTEEFTALMLPTRLWLAVFTTHSFSLAPRLTLANYLLLKSLDLGFIFFLVLRRIVLLVFV